MGAGYPPNPMTSPAASAVKGLNQGPQAKRSMKIEEVLKPSDPLSESMTLEEVKHWLKGYEAFMDQDVKASKVRVGLIRCRRLMVNENETLEAVADEVDDDIDPIPKVERRYKNLFITDPNASYAGKDSWRALKITNIRRKVVFTHCGLKVHSYYSE